MFPSLNKIRISKEATTRLHQLKGKIGLTPNIMARYAFCHSLTIPGAPNPKEYNTEGMEFNRYTLTGQHDLLMMTLLIRRLEKDGLDIEYVEDHFRAHICRGVMEIWPRIKTLLDLETLVLRAT